MTGGDRTRFSSAPENLSLRLSSNAPQTSVRARTDSATDLCGQVQRLGLSELCWELLSATFRPYLPVIQPPSSAISQIRSSPLLPQLLSPVSQIRDDLGTGRNGGAGVRLDSPSAAERWSPSRSSVWAPSFHQRARDWRCNTDSVGQVNIAQTGAAPEFDIGGGGGTVQWGDGVATTYPHLPPMSVSPRISAPLFWEKPC